MLQIGLPLALLEAPGFPERASEDATLAFAMESACGDSHPLPDVGVRRVKFYHLIEMHKLGRILFWR